ncbi:hydrogenase [[Mycobacterium] vasticus]|uniref:Hydrogenase n=1 Tax=[Mycobacterium] vasticus TaxID=2875777 RepID=A0ABU5YYL8_9MYCO|nr:hydrogenase [Mycolicibacter sp. MYC017]MEB3069931.1 hydrogenase [Mycolicibacter sp. MYC017]
MMGADKGRALLWHGVFLFLLGLLTGVVSRSLENPRMGLASHLVGVTNGLFLMALGLLWGRLRLSARWLTALFWSALYGTYVNWASSLAAAIFGTGQMTPIAAPGRHAAAWQENLVNFGFYSLSVAMLVACVIALVGLRPGEDASH